MAQINLYPEYALHAITDHDVVISFYARLNCFIMRKWMLMMKFEQVHQFIY